MNLEVKKKEQGPVLAVKGSVGVANGGGPITVPVGNGTVSGPVIGTPTGPAGGLVYGCNF